jgi:transposase
MDLRERVVRAVEGGLSRHAAAARFEVSVAFVVKLLQRWRDRGTIEPDRYGGWNKPSLAPHAAVIRDLVGHQNDITLEELRLQLAERGIETSCPTLCRFLKSAELTRKKRPNTPASKSGRMLPKRAPPGASTSPS